MEQLSQKISRESRVDGAAEFERSLSAMPRINLLAHLPDIEINVLTRHSSGLMTELIGRSLQPARLSCVCYLALVYLYGNPGNCANPSEISLAIGDTRTNMTRICDALVQRGLVHRVANSQDRRRVDLSLTAEGIALLHEVMPLVRQRVEQVMSAFSVDEKTHLLNLMARLNAALAMYLRAEAQPDTQNTQDYTKEAV